MGIIMDMIMVITMDTIMVIIMDMHMTMDTIMVMDMNMNPIRHSNIQELLTKNLHNNSNNTMVTHTMTKHTTSTRTMTNPRLKNLKRTKKPLIPKCP
jgi:heme A synthase